MQLVCITRVISAVLENLFLPFLLLSRAEGRKICTAIMTVLVFQGGNMVLVIFIFKRSYTEVLVKRFVRKCIR